MIGLTSYKVTSKPRSGEAHEKLLGMFMIYDHALTKAANRVNDDLIALHTTGQSAKELFDLWCEKGNDIFIQPDDNIPYNAANLARALVSHITLDLSLPLLLEVKCKDCLIMPSGMASPAKEWTFYVYAPACYDGSVKNEGDGVKGLMLRATEMIYEEMSRTSMEAEGSSYKLLEMNHRLMSSEERQAIENNPGKHTIYYVQLEGEFGKTPPALK